jgi:DNA mismatch repair protein MutS
MRRQYLDIKRRYPHAIVFFRLGDFYETFDEDAETVARELEITLTSRPVSKGQRVPLAGIPHHSLDAHLGKLIARGYKVAICEQVEPTGRGQKLVERRVVRVVTPGTVIEDKLLQSGANNYLAAFVGDEGAAGIAYADVSTGEFACLEGPLDEVGRELERLQPRELIVAPGLTPPPELTATLTPLDRFDREECVGRILGQFSALSLEGLGLGGQSLAPAAAGVLIDYLAENQPGALSHLIRLRSDRAQDYMRVDANTARNLELFVPLVSWRQDGGATATASTLLGVLDKTKTPMGARLLRKWLARPLLGVSEIVRRQDRVEAFFGSAVRRGRTQQILRGIPDLERLVARVSAVGSSGTPAATTPRDLVGLRRGLAAVADLQQVLESEAEPEHLSAQREMLTGLHPCSEAMNVITEAIEEDPQADRVIRAGFSDELDGFRSMSGDARQLVAGVERGERERTGIKSLKVGYNRVFGYYIEISKAHTGAVPEGYQRKQTLVGAERYTTQELQDLEYRVLHAQEQQQELEAQLLRQVCAQVGLQTAAILETAAATAEIDAACSLAEAAALYGYVRPVVDEGDAIVVKDGRHPVVERVVGEGVFVPNDIDLSSGVNQVIVLTGPNMAGKSTYLRQVALTAIMAQMGSFVPAAEARVGVVDRLFSRVGALDDIATGRSTFMVEMLETAAILHGATPRSLLIFDEIGRGTSTYDGVAIARAVVEFVHNRPDAAARCLFATHYHELTELASLLPRVRNFNVAVTEEQGGVVFLHRILPGGADRSYGVHVAQLAGLPRPVVQRAQELLVELESSATGKTPVAESASLQLALFRQEGSLARELSQMEVDGMTPLEAITKLYEIVERAQRALAV